MLVAYILGALCLFAVIADQVWTRRERTPPRLYRPSPTFGWTLTPGITRRVNLVRNGQVIWENDIHVNAHGFNDREWSASKPAKCRVLVMGDSIIESRQVERPANFVARAEVKLNAVASNRYELFNVGVAGWSVDSALNYFQQVGHALKPDVVVLGLFLGNDLIEGDYDTFRYLFAYAWDCRRYDKPAFGLRNGHLVRWNFPAWRNVLARVFSEEMYLHSRTYRRGYQRYSRFMEKRKNGSNLLRAQGVSYNQHMEQTKGNAFFYAQTEAQVDALADACRRAGVKFGVMLEPNFPLFYPLTEPDPPGRAYQEYHCDLNHYNEMRRRLSTEYPVLSLIEPLHAAGQTITFKPADPHFNRAGHELVGGLLADFIGKLE